MLHAIAQRGLHPLDASYETCVLDSMTARSDSEYLTRIDIPVGAPAPVLTEPIRRETLR